MAKVRIALAQVNATVGDLAGNADIIVGWTRRAAARGARVAVFPEMALTGYPVEDLALRASFVEASIAALRDVAERLNVEGLGGVAVVAGYLDRRAGLAPRTGLPAGAPLDAAAVLHGGRVVITSAKHHLPNYGVFDEFRYFVPGSTLPVFRLPLPETGEAVDVAVAICEDLWQDGGPVAVTRHAGAALLVVPNASPYERGKHDVRLDLVQRRAREAGAALAYCNLVGGQDELVFDGDSILVSSAGEPLARGPQFEEALIVADLDLPPAQAGPAPGRLPDPDDIHPGEGALPQSSGSGDAVDAGDGTLITIERVTLPDIPLPAAEGREAETGVAADGEGERGPFWPRLDDLAEVYAALVLGTADYVRKNGFRSVLLALSGGIDSALVATIAADAIGPQNVSVILMPSKWSSDHSVRDAEDLVERQGVNARTVPIQPIVDAFRDGLGDFPLSGLPAENLQSRVRGVINMAVSNDEGHLVLTTGNKSEIATGYSTLYGDSAGGFAPIKDVPKTLVWALSRWRNAEAERQGRTPPIPPNSISKPPSAELAPGQLDTDSLPDYVMLDALLDDYVEKDMGSAELIGAGHDPGLVARVIRLVDLAEYKRRQYPPGPKISQKNFGRDRRLPITSRWREIVPGWLSDPGETAASPGSGGPPRLRASFHGVMEEGQRAGSAGRYGALLVTLIAAYLVSAVAQSRWGGEIHVAFIAVIGVLSLRNARRLRPRVAQLARAAIVLTAITAGICVTSDNTAAKGAGGIWGAAMLLLTVLIIVGRVLRVERVTAQSLYAAVSAYLLIGMMFSEFFSALDVLVPGPFFANGQPANSQTLQYFSFATLTTLGYGDFTAVGSLGRAVAVLEALSGQVFLATLVARLVSAYDGGSPRRPPPEQ